MCSHIEAMVDRAIACVDHPLAPPRCEENMRKSLPDQMFVDPEKSRLTMLRGWCSSTR